MWESPQELWRRLKLGREEFLQRTLTTLIVGGDPPPWIEARTPSKEGVRFLRLLDALAHGDEIQVQGTHLILMPLLTSTSFQRSRSQP
jgi:hypothetical protein